MPRELRFEQRIILEGMARALWVHAFMIWSIEVEPPPYPVQGGDDVRWDDIAPDNASTRAASGQAAEALAQLIGQANRLGDYPLAKLFAKVSAKWDADRAYAFGQEVAHLCMGTRDADDSVFFLPRGRPGAGERRWDPVLPNFKVDLDDDGRDLTWDGGLSYPTRNCGCHANPAAPGEVKQILVIEDDPQLQRAYPRMMRKMYPGAEVTIVDNYDDAIGYLDTRPADLIISDVDLVGDRTGIDVFGWVRENHPELVDRYVFVTGGNPQVEQLHYRYAEKPATVAEIQAAIDKPTPRQNPPSKTVTAAAARKLVKVPISDEAAERVAECINEVVRSAQRAPPRAPPGDFRERFDAAFDRLDRGHNYVLVYDLRQALPDLSRAEFDAALNHLRRQKLYSMDSADGRHVRLSAPQREAGIQEAGSNLVYVQRREPPMKAVPITRPMDLPTFAAAVLEVLPTIEQDPDADDRARGRFGSEKVFIGAIWRRLEHDPRFAGMTKAQFQRHLVDAQREGILNLARADLVAAMNHAEVMSSEIRDHGSEFHFVIDPVARQRRGW